MEPLEQLRELSRSEKEELRRIFLQTEFQRCANRDNKQLFRSLLLTLNLIVVVTLTLFFSFGEAHGVQVVLAVSLQISLSFLLLLTMYWTAFAGCFLSFAAFSIPFFLLLLDGQMAGARVMGMSHKEKTIIVWEWLLYPVGMALYVISFFFYWIFRRLRRNYYMKH